MVKVVILPSIVGGGLSSKGGNKRRKRETVSKGYILLILVLSLLFWVVLTLFLAYNVLVGDVIFLSGMGPGNAKMGPQKFAAERPFYNISSIPLVTRSYLHAFVKRGSCEGNSRVIISRCCRGSCGDMTSRVEGLAVLLMFAKQAGRKLCLAQDYFFSGDAPICNGGGAYLQISDNSLLFPQPMAGGVDAEALLLNREATSVMNLKNISYISSSLLQNSSELLRISLQPLEVETGDTYYDLINARRLGMAAIAYSRVLDRDMGQAEGAVHESLRKLVPSVPGPQTGFVALFVKAGGAFTSRVRKDVHVLNQYDHIVVMGRNRSAPDSILQAAWAMQRTKYKCNRPLFIIRLVILACSYTCRVILDLERS